MYPYIVLNIKLNNITTHDGIIKQLLSAPYVYVNKHMTDISNMDCRPIYILVYQSLNKYNS